MGCVLIKKADQVGGRNVDERLLFALGLFALGLFALGRHGAVSVLVARAEPGSSGTLVASPRRIGLILLRSVLVC
jgi:hypothetical protein